MKWFETKRPILALAPMADVTDAPFCRIVKETSSKRHPESPTDRHPGLDPGSDSSVVIFREMISAAALVRGSSKTHSMAKIEEVERPAILQIFGSDPAMLAEAARILEDMAHPEGIDINMGCPAKKIVSNFDGSSLMRDPEKATQIIKAVKAAVTVPVSVKTRLGWSKPEEILDFSKAIEAAGADLITVHGRTKEQAYAGKADWEMIGRAKQGLAIPLLANGDIVDAESAKRCLEVTGADGLMIGRGALGNPWIFNEICTSLCHSRHLPCHSRESGNLLSQVPGSSPRMTWDTGLADRVETALRHAHYQVEHFGEKGLVNLRKHLPLYFKRELKKDYPNVDFLDLRSKLVRISTFEELETIFKNLSL